MLPSSHDAGLTAEQLARIESETAARRQERDAISEGGLEAKLQDALAARRSREAALAPALAKAAGLTIDNGVVVDQYLQTSVPGVVTGLAYTTAGGEVLHIEADAIVSMAQRLGDAFLAAKYVEPGLMPCAQVQIVRKGQLVHQTVLGHADREDRRIEWQAERLQREASGSLRDKLLPLRRIGGVGDERG